MDQMTQNKEFGKNSPQRVSNQSFWTLSRKLLIPGVALLVIITFGLIIYNAFNVVVRNQSEAKRDLSRTKAAIEASIDQLRNLALGLATEMANTPQVQAAFAAQDRELLTEIALPIFEIVKTGFDVKQYQFILPPATSFLRLHQLDRFGDDLSSIRFTVLEANATQKPVSGIEIGRAGLGVRGEVPVFYEGRHIGVVDVGLDIGPDYLSNLKELYGVDTQIFLETGAAEAATFAGSTSEISGPTANLLIQSSTFAEPVFADSRNYEQALGGETVISTVTTNGRTYAIVSAPLRDFSGKIIGVLDISVDRTDIIASQSQSLILSVVLSLLATVLGSYLLVRNINSVLRPVGILTETAELLARGDLERQAVVQSQDELGVLASTFNTMTNRLREILSGLEQRVAERTRNLELAAEVGRSVSQLRALDVMLKDACGLILKEFNLYYVQVYLIDPSQTTLKLEAGTGEVGMQLIGRGHSLPLDTSSLNGRAAIEQRSIVIPDTSLSATFRPNDLLPETRGEMAVPLIVANNVVGVLDMQSSEPGTLNEEVLPAFEALAGQLAVAVQNANLLTEAEQARAQVEVQSRRLVREAWSEYLDAIHKPEQVGFVFEHNAVAPLEATGEAETPVNGNAISVPIAITGEQLGSLVVEIDDEARREQSGELINVVARQVAQQIENLRLLDSAERYRFEAEQAVRLQTVEGWQDYIQSRPMGKLGYLYDQREVLPGDEKQLAESVAFSLPVKARDEVVGRLAIQGLSSDDTEAVELASAIAERLGAHIENLRLFEETRRGQLELDKRARQLAAVAQVSTASSQELDVQRILETVVRLTQRQFGLYHAHVFVLDERTNELRIAACGWKEGDEREGTHETGIIPMTREQSLVAQAAQTHRPVLVNDVRTDPNWLPNPQLPATRSELAVPLLIGDRVLGVLDVQSDQLNAFTEEDANIQLTLASQVAVSLQNAFSFSQAQKQAEREALLNTINQKIQSATSVEAVLQIAARELGHALNVPRTIAQISIKDQK